MIICEKEKCTGCYACYNSCINHAIEMIEDEFGYIYPKINNHCIGCGLCKSVCPSNIEEINEGIIKKPMKAYAAWSLNKVERITSSSGAMASVLSREVINQGGVVFGAAYTSKLEVTHICIEDVNDLYKLKGSKYVQSKIGDSLIKVKKALMNNKLVLFIGTPCQVAGLIRYLKKPYSQLITVDIVCHGVPPLKMLKEYVKEEINTDDIDSINFREGNNYVISFIKNSKIVYRKVIRESTYFMGFMESIICRENCFSCKYARPERISDITVGDFWGIGKTKEFNHDTSEGVSLVLQNTKKGELLIESCKEIVYLEERELDEAINGNSQLRHPSMKNKKRKKFKKLYLKYGFNVAIKMCLIRDFFKYKIKKILVKFISM